MIWPFLCICWVLFCRLAELLEEHNYTKKKVCSAIDIERTNFNRYYRDEFQRIDANLILKLCEFFDCEPGELFEIAVNPQSARERVTVYEPVAKPKKVVVVGIPVSGNGLYRNV